MNEFVDKAALLLGNASISEMSIEQLEQLVNEYPYFSIAQVMLAKKYKLQHHKDFLPQTQKAALYFHNPHWLHYQLMDATPGITISDPVKEVKEKAADEELEKLHSPELDDSNEQTSENRKIEFTNDEYAAASTLAKETLAVKTETYDTAGEEDIQINPDELHPEKEEVLEEIVQDYKSPVNHITLESEPSEILSEASNEELETTTPGHFETNEAETVLADTLQEKDLVASVVEDSLVKPVSLESLDDEKQTSEADSTLRLKNDVEGDSPTAGEPLIPIEPYYTVDYFASQGIKLSLDKNPQDKLGKQLKSFTEWLKHMKKLGPEDAMKSTTTETEVDSTIKNIADTSNTPKEIITEAMAEVLIKQGKNDQAIEVYNKLSFLNPDKSTYFANQIQKLKGS